ncbi:hypothetical protein [uncultured Algimonas sp.]|uniref:hypothetical protein n=1 Tax=uncultured Algimonas sp. TaxID=1547920 RepID=UPI00260766D2|nr:hypothetical protein [uncultured Algimonas sp.]
MTEPSIRRLSFLATIVIAACLGIVARIDTPKPELYPAEIRNAVSIDLDRLAEQGAPVDQANTDGIGLDAGAEALSCQRV